MALLADTSAVASINASPSATPSSASDASHANGWTYADELVHWADIITDQQRRTTVFRDVYDVRQDQRYDKLDASRPHLSVTVEDCSYENQDSNEDVVGAARMEVDMDPARSACHEAGQATLNAKARAQEQVPLQIGSKGGTLRAKVKRVPLAPTRAVAGQDGSDRYVGVAM